MKAKVLEPRKELHSFMPEMREYIGEIIDVVKNNDGLFLDINVGGYLWFPFWLEFINEEKPIMSDGDKFLKGLMEEIDGSNLIITEKQPSHWFPLYLDGIREYLSKFEN